MLYPRGSEWRKWDLHIHTPESLVHNYSGTKEEAWDKFINDLEALPAEFKVIGINDYLFLSGYRKVLEEKKRGRLSNIDLILPVIELRLDKFGGSASKFSRVNYHIIFSNEIEPDQIEAQFLNALKTKYQLSAQYSELKTEWHSLVTMDSLTDLGTMIINSVPDAERRKFGTPLQEGFNNLNLSLSAIHEALKNHYLEGKYITAIGKTEWWDIKWNDQSIAEKKSVINDVDWVFIASASPSDWEKAKNHLINSNVNHRLLDCSDAHHFSNSTHKDRIGNCFTWIKADPTFTGLQLALQESVDRVFIGSKPDKVKHRELNSTKYIHKIEVSKTQTSAISEHWFDNTSIEFNSDLVAIIGNKGSGKSALTDILGIAGNTLNSNNFSFLNEKRFRRLPEDKAKHFQATLIWESQTSQTVNLSDPIDESAVEKIKYIPQGLFEDICSEVPGGAKSKFDEEIERVIFSRLPQSAQLNMSSLQELIDHKTEVTNESIEFLKQDLMGINKEIVKLQEETSPNYEKRLNALLEQKQNELTAHIKQKPAEIREPNPEAQDSELQRELKKVSEQLASILSKTDEVVGTENEIAHQLTSIERLTTRINNLRETYRRFIEESNDDAQRLALNLDEIVRFEVSDLILKDKKDAITANQSSTVLNLDPNNPSSLISQRKRIEHTLSGIHEKLDEPTKLYQDYLNSLQQWQNILDEILGTEQQPDSLKHIEANLEALKTTEERLNAARTKRLEISTQIHEKIVDLATEYEKLYKSVQAFIDTNPIAKDKLALNFDVSIVNVDLSTRFFEWISRASAGSFRGRGDGEKMLQNIIARHSFETSLGVEQFLGDLEKHLTKDMRGTENEVDISSQLKDNKSLESFYDYIYSLEYLKPRYVLRMGEKELSQLSPGEKGALLLIFYLLVDKSDLPLVIDQPEENLDNQTVFQLLVDAIKDAKKRRQIILATHNPNLAVVCDAEQIICAEIDKSNGNKVSYKTGAIEEKVINRLIVDILEGTKPAFDNRKLKYSA